MKKQNANRSVANTTGKYSHRVTADYNGKPIKEGYVMVPTIPDALDIAENVTNAECIITIPIPGTLFFTKAVLRAVKVEDEQLFRKQYTSWQNDRLRHFIKKNAISSDKIDGDDVHLFDEERSTKNHVEDLVHGKENAVKAFLRLCDEAPQYAAAMFFLLFGSRGKDFDDCMRISSPQAKQVYHELERILPIMIQDGYLAVEKVRKNKTKNDTYYRQVIKENMELILDRLVSYFETLS